MLILLGLLLVLLFFGLGFALHALWIIAIVLFVAWLIGLVLGRGENAWPRSFLSLVAERGRWNGCRAVMCGLLEPSGWPGRAAR